MDKSQFSEMDDSSLEYAIKEMDNSFCEVILMILKRY